MSCLDALVIGSGPVGLLLAIELRRHGVQNIRIIDKLEKPAHLAKASALWPRSLEIFEAAGGKILETIQRHALEIRSVKLYDYDHQTDLVKLDLTNSNLIGLACEQWFDEATLTTRLKDFNVEVERGVEITKINDSGDKVDVELKKLSSSSSSGFRTESIQAKYVIGCDGAHSFVRHALDFKFEGEQFPAKFALAHCQIASGQMPNENIWILSGSEGFVFGVLMPENTYLIVIDLTSQQAQKYSPDKFTLENLEEILHHRGLTDVKLINPIWVTYFNVHSRQVSKYSKGRVFLCGDAAHIHSPIGGQGMNMGYQDANNLAWKLALVLRNQASCTLLNSYDIERKTIDRSILNWVERAQNMASLRQPVLLFVRNNIARMAGTLQFLLDAGYKTASQTAYTYGFLSSLNIEYWENYPIYHPVKRREHNIFRLFGVRVRAGDRAPDIVLQNEYKDDYSENKERKTIQRLYQLINSKPAGFKALLFEGNKEYLRPSDSTDLFLLSQEIEKESQGLVTSIIIPSSETKLHQLYGVHEQALFLIRPDGYVALRSDPISVHTLCYYLSSHVHATQIRSELTRPPSRHDIVPTFILLAASSGWSVFIYLLRNYLKNGGNNNNKNSLIGLGSFLTAGTLWFFYTLFKSRRH